MHGASVCWLSGWQSRCPDSWCLLGALLVANRHQPPPLACNHSPSPNQPLFLPPGLPTVEDMQVSTSPYAAARAAAAAPAAAAGRDLARAAHALEQYEVGRMRDGEVGMELAQAHGRLLQQVVCRSQHPLLCSRPRCRTRGSLCLGLAQATCRSSSASSQRPETLRRQGGWDGHRQQALVPSCTRWGLFARPG